jgi:hypothetical protein
MTNATELSLIWHQLTTTYQQLNRTTNGERERLLRLADMLRIEYRQLTSVYADRA